MFFVVIQVKIIQFEGQNKSKFWFQGQNQSEFGSESLNFQFNGKIIAKILGF